MNISVPDEGYSSSVPCALKYMPVSTPLLVDNVEQVLFNAEYVVGYRFQIHCRKGSGYVSVLLFRCVEFPVRVRIRVRFRFRVRGSMEKIT